MKILVVHNRYQNPGGEDQVFEAECSLLENAGHTVIRYERHNNEISEWKRLTAPLQLLFTTIWSRRTSREVGALIEQHKPDIVHCHNTFPLISPSVFYTAVRYKVPVVQTLHNYRLTCLNGYLFRDGKVCEKCFARFPLSGLRYRCYRNSLPASSVVTLAWFIHFKLLRTWQNKIQRFITLSSFSYGKFKDLGLPQNKLVLKPNPVSVPDHTRLDESHHPTALYVGRLSPEKGVDVLINAWIKAFTRTDNQIRPRLLIAGDGPQREELQLLAGEQAEDENSGIQFLGQKNRADLTQLLQSADLLVSPGLGYETFGIAAVEAQASALPVIVSDHGALAELVEAGITGFKFPVGSVDRLAEVLRQAFSDRNRLKTMGKTARERYLAGDSAPQNNLRKLEQIYRAAIADYNSTP